MVSSRENTQNALVKYHGKICKHVEVVIEPYFQLLCSNKQIYCTVLQQLSSHAYMILKAHTDKLLNRQIDLTNRQIDLIDLMDFK